MCAMQSCMLQGLVKARTSSLNQYKIFLDFISDQFGI